MSVPEALNITSIFMRFNAAPSHRQLLLPLSLWVRRQQEREFETLLSLLSRKHKVRNKSVIIKWNKSGLELHSWRSLVIGAPEKEATELIAPLSKKNGRLNGINRCYT